MAALNLRRLSARVARARSAVHKGVKYGLGKGGNLPNAATPADGGLCDCSGFALAWVFYLARRPKNGRPGWLETTAVARDATGAQKTWVAIERPIAGCAVVYGDHGGEQGHCAVVTDATFDAKGRVATLHGVDCSSGRSRATGEAINERDLSFFIAKNPVYAVLKEDLA